MVSDVLERVAHHVTVDPETGWGLREPPLGSVTFDVPAERVEAVKDARTSRHGPPPEAPAPTAGP